MRQLAERKNDLGSGLQAQFRAPCSAFSLNSRIEKAGVLVRPTITAPASRRRSVMSCGLLHAEHEAGIAPVGEVAEVEIHSGLNADFQESGRATWHADQARRVG